jgi:hypothetical protein
VIALLGAAGAVGARFAVPGSAAPPVSVPIRTISPASATSPASTPSGSGTTGQPGIAISARPDTDGSFLVSEIVTLPAAVTEAVLRPPVIADAGTGFEGLRPAAVNVEVNAGGQVLAVPDGPIGSEVTLRWASSTSSLRLHYRLTQVSIASAPAKTGRRLAVFGSLLGQMPADLPVSVVVTGRTLLSLTCPQLPLAEMSCGAGIAPKFWTLRPIPFDRSRVQVQYDRPTRR